MNGPVDAMDDTSGEQGVTRVLVADDQALIRMGVRGVLAPEPDLVVVGEAEDGEEAVRMCRDLRPDVVLMDLSMPGMDGLAATRLVKESYPKTAVVVLTAHEDEDLLLEAVRAGAAGYVLKMATLTQLVGAVRSVLAGGSLLDQDLAMRLLRRIAGEIYGRQEPQTRPAAEESPVSSLTPRELEVLRHLATGKTNRRIAQDLYLSLSTIKRHVERTIAKLGVSDRTQAAVRAVELGLLPERER